MSGSNLNDSCDLFEDDNETNNVAQCAAASDDKIVSNSNEQKACLENLSHHQTCTSPETKSHDIDRIDETQCKFQALVKENILSVSDSDTSLEPTSVDNSFVEEPSNKRQKAEADCLIRESTTRMENQADRQFDNVKISTNISSISDRLMSKSDYKNSDETVTQKQLSKGNNRDESCRQTTSSDTCCGSTFTCPFCQRLESSLSDLETHIASRHPDGSSADVEVEDSGINKQWTCPLCDIDLDCEQTLTAHLNSEHRELDGGHSCLLCGFTCSSEYELQAHVEMHNEDGTHYSVGVEEGSRSTPSNLTCPLCGLPFADSELLQSHVDTVHGEDEGGPNPSYSDLKLNCPICGLSLGDPDLLTSHVEGHFSPQHRPGQEEANSLPRKASCIDKGETSTVSKKKTGNINKENIPFGDKTVSSTMPSLVNRATASTLSSSNASSSESLSGRDTHCYRRQFEQSLERAVMRGDMSVAEYHEQRASMTENDLHGVDDGSSRVDGLIEHLARLYRQQARPGQTAILCYPASHFSGSHGDRGWGCGYRNFQMLLSCLVGEPEYARRIFPKGVAIPSIPKVQQMIEMAWRNGFDTEGCLQLNGKLVGTQKWIGATEIVAVLSFLGIRCRLADFHAPSSADGTHPRLMEWVSDYFTTRRNQFTAPLYLQHQGHSRTIVGVETDRDTTRLLLFDPGSRSEHIASLVTGGGLVWKNLRTFRRTVAAFKARQYQIVAIDGLLNPLEVEGSKIIKSDRIS